MNKIMVFSRFFTPAKNYGGPTTSLKAIIENCSDENEFYIVAANHDFGSDTVFENISDGWNTVGLAKVLYIKPESIYYNEKRIREILLEIKPDMVWLVGILVPSDNWFVASACRKLGIPYLISPRGDVCTNTFKLKYYKKKPVSMIAKLFGVYKDAYYHSTSDDETAGLIKQYNAPKDRIFLVPNIASSFEVRKKENTKEPGKLRIIFVSRLQLKKNLIGAIKAVNLVKSDVIFDIYGPQEQQEYWQECEEEIKRSPANVRIEYKGSLPAEKVSDAFLGYDCFLFPTMSENYGHVIAESLFSSCPLVLTRGTTPWDDLDGKAGFLCELSDISSYTAALEKIAAMDKDAYALLLSSLNEYYNAKIQSDDAVAKHKKMINAVIGK